MVNETYHPRGELVDGYAVKEHPIYYVWASMKSRCNDCDSTGYENYGGRGITYCAEWGHFVNFAADMFPSWREGLTIERVDNDLGYGPDNCIWADRTSQCHNRRTFKNNTTGFDGVVRMRGGNFNARYDHEKVRYALGSYLTAEAAALARSHFIRGFHADDKSVLQMTDRRARLDGSTGVRGVTVAPDGFIVRRTVGGVRKYYGITKTLDEAKALLRSRGHDC